MPRPDHQIYRGRRLCKFLMQGADDDHCRVIRHDNAHCLAQGGKVHGRRIEHGIDLGQQILDRHTQRFCFRRQPHHALATFQQRVVEKLAAAFQRTRCGRLRQTKPVRRTRYMRLIEKCVQHDEEIKIDGTQIHVLDTSTCSRSH